MAVWVGNAEGEGRPGLTGTSAAAPLMFSLFNLLPQNAWFIKPSSDLERVKTCVVSGFKASEICNQVAIYEYPKGASKTRPCSFHKLVYLDETGRYRVNSNCYPIHRMKTQPWFTLSPSQEFYFKQHNATYKALPEYLAGCSSESAIAQLEIIYPHEGYKIYVPVDQSGSRSRCIFKATHKNSAASIYWYLDGDYLGSTQKFHEITLQPSKGMHTVEITDNFGESAHCEFEVIEK